eukprot:gene10949-12758_t
MHIGSLRIPWHADRTHPPVTLHPKAQHHGQRQRQAVGAQLHAVPATRGAPQLPAILVAAQATDRRTVSQQDMTRQYPTGMGQAQQGAKGSEPPGHIEKPQRTQ